MARILIKPGDVFVVRLSNNEKKYFQYLCSDLTQLNSYVIRTFKKSFPVDATPELSEIVTDEIDFHAHVFLRLGIKMGYWEKVGNIKNVGNIDHILFRGTEDYGSMEGEEPIKVSSNWYIWKINGDFKQVGKLEGENKKAEIGVVVNPEDIVTRMKTGKYDFFYPGFEYIN